jgi:hypothetical protein
MMIGDFELMVFEVPATLGCVFPTEERLSHRLIGRKVLMARLLGYYDHRT